MKQLFTLTIAFLGTFACAFAQDNWPRTINGEDGSKISIYEPEPEYISGDEFTGRAAVAVKKSPNDEPIFGAMLFTASMKNQNSSKDVAVESLRITKMKLAGEENEDQLEKLSNAVEDDAENWNWGMSADELKKKIEKEQQTATGEGFNNTAPKIIYRNKPSTLVVLDGDPRVLYDKDLATDKVVNSPNIIFKEKGKWNLYAGGSWYQSNNVTGGWKHNNDLSAKVRSVETEIKKQEKESRGDDVVQSDPRQTEIIVSTQPAELIQTDGEPVYKNISGTSLLYVSNSPNEIFKDINNQKTYILIAGRWYQASNLSGPWTYIPSDKLPADFAQIPQGSDKQNVRANVAGTDEAENAVLDAAMPQTARVDRKTATVDVEYDGAPQFSRIRGTSLSLAENANVTVIRDADGYYFALDNGIWFISDDAYGPWAVANDRPRDIDDIPASSPAYYSRYVDIYDVSADYVYMGYTPGYLGSYVYGPTVIYGTGYHYRPWFRRMYYPRPVTWGFGFMYDPWYGWNFNFGYNYGYMYVGFRPHYYSSYYGGGWFGPQRYCPSYGRSYWNDGYYRRGDYYGRRNDEYRSRPARPYYGSAQNGNGRLYGRAGNNLYSEQRGVTTSTVSRVPRIYRPGTGNTVAGSGLRERMEGRRPALTNPQRNNEAQTLPRGNSRVDYARPQTENSRRERMEGNNNNGELQRPDVNRRQMPELTNPQRNENNPQGRLQREPLENRQPSRESQPSLQNRQQRERPSLERRENAPRVNYERPNTAPAPRVNERQNAPAPRVNYERQHSAPAPRPIERSAPAPRPAIERPSGGSQRSEQSRRPDRR